MWSKQFWKGAGERAVKTFLQTFVAVVVLTVGEEAIGVSAGLADVSWLDAMSVAAVATVLSLATAVGNADFTAGIVHPELSKAEHAEGRRVRS